MLDYAILVINGMDGVQGHIRTLWSLLRRYQIPVFLFFNKMDQEWTDREKLLEELKRHLDEFCIAFDQEEKMLHEELATCEEPALEEYLENGLLQEETIARLIAARNVFPCYFGSALKLRGVQELMDGLKRYTCYTCCATEMPSAARGSLEKQKESQGNEEHGQETFKDCI